jgi:hypothetical protein
MSVDNKEGFYSFRGDANALGGFIAEPVRREIQTLVPVSLPTVGGYTEARSEGFHLDSLVRCRSAHALVSGRVEADQLSILATSVVEGLNILDAIEAVRVVARLSIVIPRKKGSKIKVSTVGSYFEGLRLAGQPRRDVDDCFDRAGKASSGQVIDIPEVGRVILGALYVTDSYAQLVSIRAELGCPIKGKITVNCGGGGGVHE